MATVSSIINSLNSTADTTTTTTTTGVESGMGQDAFLKMFMAQLTNQNPLDPMDNTEFTAQLATFSSLEQLTNINSNLENLADLKTSVDQAAMASYIGKEVTMEGDVLPVNDGYVGKASYTLAAEADVRAVITDADGNLVAEVDLGHLAAGSHEFQWDGTTTAGQSVPDGVYQITIGANDSRGDTVEVSDQQVTGLVTGWQKGSDDENYLLLGDAALPLSSVLSVTQPSTQSDSTTTTTTTEDDSSTSSSTTSTDGDETLQAILDGLVNLGGLAALLL